MVCDFLVLNSGSVTYLLCGYMKVDLSSVSLFFSPMKEKFYYILQRVMIIQRMVMNIEQNHNK